MGGPLILGIESATSRVGCAIGGPDGVLAARESARPRRHAESLVPQIAEIVQESGVAMADIGVVAVDIDRVSTPVCALVSPQPSPWRTHSAQRWFR